MKRYLAEAKHSGFSGRERDPKEEIAYRHFVEEMEIAIALANREVIHGRLPNLNRNAFQKLAVMVARFRAEYLEAAIKLSDSVDTCDARCLADLKHKRDLYDQGCAAFEALERAIERGFVDLDAQS